MHLCKHWRLLTITTCAFILSACTSTPKLEENSHLINSTLAYYSTLAPDHPDSFENLFYIPNDIRDQVHEKFSSNNRHGSASKLANWLMSSEGHDLEYELDANLKPYDTYTQKRGNCLSFTLLMLTLGEELDINLKVNQVNLPDTWGAGDENDLVFYRHVNAVFKSPSKTQIFDLALEDYRSGYPQQLITKHQAAALLYSNIGIQKLKDEDFGQALHYLKLSASTFPENADMWINLGAAYKRLGDIDKAEEIYLKALASNDQNNLAASNLERLYRSQGKKSLADHFEKLAAKSRKRNPYLHYNEAKELFDNKRYLKASKSIRRAIKLHNLDPDFFELSSRIHQARNKPIEALKNLETAHNLSKTNEERIRYTAKVEMVLAQLRKQQEQHNQAFQNDQRFIKVENFETGDIRN